jgi:hypothetical protein
MDGGEALYFETRAQSHLMANLEFCFHSSYYKQHKYTIAEKYTETCLFKRKDQNFYLINNQHLQGSKRKKLSFKHLAQTLNCCNHYCWRLCLKLEKVNQSLDEQEKGLLYNTSAANDKLIRR